MLTNGTKNGKILKRSTKEKIGASNMDFKKNIHEIEKKIHYTFKDKSLLMQAFTRTSFCNEHKRENYISNEVLEFFGDSVLSTAIVTMLLNEKTSRYEHGIFTELSEGDFSNIRSKLSDKRNLSKSMRELGLQRFLQMGEGDLRLGVENEPSVMEDLFESIVGAVYIDSDMDLKRVFATVSAMLDLSVYNSTSGAAVQSYKNALQEWCADKKHRLPPPVYKTVSESGPEHKRVFERAVIIGERTYAVGKGKNQKAADSAAAEAALEVLKREAEPIVEVNGDALTKLREFASKNKKPSPEFRDLGETPKSTVNAKEFVIECRFMDKSVMGVAKSKQEARAIAADKILKELTSPAEKRSAKKAKEAKAPEKKAAPRLQSPKSVQKNAKKSDKAASPKKERYQHKKHL